jgi:hypothetical protein
MTDIKERLAKLRQAAIAKASTPDLVEPSATPVATEEPPPTPTRQAQGNNPKPQVKTPQKAAKKAQEDKPKPQAKASQKAPAVTGSRPKGGKGTRYRLIKGELANAYLVKILEPACVTHNATVAKALKTAGQGGISFDDLVANILKTGWKTTSANPSGILRWHLGCLELRHKLVERVQ